MSSRSVGRPAYEPTPEDRQSVEMMKFIGEHEIVIAAALSISVPTLRKHFKVELKTGHAKRKKEVVGLLFAAARNGNVSAQKKLEDLGRAAGAGEAVKRREPKAGKKEERQAVAHTVSGIYAPPESPKLRVVG